MFSSQLTKTPETQRPESAGAAHHQPHTSAIAPKPAHGGGLEYLLIRGGRTDPTGPRPWLDSKPSPVLTSGAEAPTLRNCIVSVFVEGVWEGGSFLCVSSR